MQIVGFGMEENFEKVIMLVERVIALVLILLLLPLFLFFVILVRLNIGSPVFFRQDRPGRNCIIFSIVKFRTMLDITNLEGELLSDKERLTKFGQFLRSSSLDELPTLWNVFKGEISFVGPRPLLVKYLPLYTERQSRRHEVKPGITGWAQINGRNSISWEDRLEMDVWYVDNRSLSLDIKILWKTIFRVFKRDGINQEGYATMPDFKGNQNKDNND